MALFGKGKSTLDRRLKDVNREIARLDREMRTAARTAYARAAVRAESEREETAETGEAGESGAPAEAPAGVFPDFSVRGGAQADAQMDLFEPGFSDSSVAQRDPRIRPGKERFASYFMAGHFSEMRPLRQERRVMRNKAIFMAVLAILALIWFIYMKVFL